MNEVSLWYQPVLEGLGYAIVHSLWQGVLLFFPLQVMLFFCKKAQWRYRLLYSGFALLFFSFIITFVAEWNSAVTMQQQSASMVDFIIRDKGVNTEWNAIINVPEHWWQKLAGFYHTPAFRKMLPVISTCYAIGILLLGVRMFLSFGNLKRIRQQVIPVSEALQERFGILVSLVDVKRKVALYFSEHIHVPMMMGHLKPIIILPVALINQLDWQQAEAIIMHELAHVKRLDYLFNILQSVMEIFLFFNPMAWWFSGIIRKEREHCCDDTAIQHTEQPVKYAEALLQLELNKQRLKPAMAATGDNKKHSLLNRIKRIVDMKSTPNRSPQSIFATLTFLMIFAALFGYYVTMAQENKKDAPKKQTQQTTTTTIVSDSYDAGDPAESDIPEPPVPPVPPGMDTVVAQSLDAANLALANINWDDVNDAIQQAGSEIGKINWDDIGKDLDDAQKEIDDAQREIDNIDWSEINKSINEAQQTMKDIDWNEISNNINNSLQSVQTLDKATRDKIMKEVQQAMNKSKIAYKNAALQSHIIMDSLNTMRGQTLSNLRSSKQAQMKQLSYMRDTLHRNIADARRLSLQANTAARKAAADAKKAAAESNKTSGLLNKLQQNGLIDRNTNFAVSYKNNVLTVNGKNVPVADYQEYLPKGDKVSLKISGNKNNLAISQKE